MSESKSVFGHNLSKISGGSPNQKSPKFGQSHTFMENFNPLEVVKLTLFFTDLDMCHRFVKFHLQDPKNDLWKGELQRYVNDMQRLERGFIF